MFVRSQLENLEMALFLTSNKQKYISDHIKGKRHSTHNGGTPIGLLIRGYPVLLVHARIQRKGVIVGPWTRGKSHTDRVSENHKHTKPAMFGYHLNGVSLVGR